MFTVLFNNLASLLGLLIVVACIPLPSKEMSVLDGVAFVLVGIILATTAGFLACECQSLPMGKGIAVPMRDNIRPTTLGRSAIVAGSPEVWSR